MTHIDRWCGATHAVLYALLRLTCHARSAETSCFTNDSEHIAQIQEELDSLAQQATANAMYVIKSEKHVFTNNAAYMKLLNKMKAYVMRKQDGEAKSGFAVAYNDARDAEDEVHSCCLPLPASVPACCLLHFHVLQRQAHFFTPNFQSCLDR